MALSPCDPNSFSRPDLANVTHIHLDLTVDFQRKILYGNVILDVEKTSETDFLILDVNGLIILSITSVSDGSKLNFCIETEVQYHGSKLTVQLPEAPDTESEKPKYKIKIEYRTSEDCAALQWLEPEQTSGGKHPYVFSQCQAILARCMLPCQDTPTVKTTYSAEIKAPSELTVLMSALKGDVEDLGNSTKLHKFNQPVKIPSYLIALAVGAIVSKEIGPRSKVWAEKELIDQAAYEFAETEKVIQSLEELCGPYVWGVYDLLVPPPSFAYGGMENPCLTFVSSTILAGDRSLADVVVHEICHSWTGNLVTNTTFEHYWLNEGHTVFLERKAIGRMHGEKHRHFEALEGLQKFKKELMTLQDDDPATRLVPDTSGIDPDDCYSETPYEKGQTLLFYLEELLGGPEVFDKFLRSYIDTFKYRSLNSQQWKDYLYSYFSDKTDILDKVDWEAWFFKPGMFPVTPNYDTSMVDACQSLVDKWLTNEDPNAFNKLDMDDWIAKQKSIFLGELVLHKKILTIDQLKLMDEIYHVGSMKNSEIRLNWLLLCLKSRWEDKVTDALEFGTSTGRLKLIRPIFKALYDWKEVRQRAIDVYLANKDKMMSVTRYMIGKDLHLAE